MGNDDCDLGHMLHMQVLGSPSLSQQEKFKLVGLPNLVLVKSLDLLFLGGWRTETPPNEP